MKVLVLANSDGGLYNFRKELLTELLKNHEVVLSAPEGEYASFFREIGCKLIPMSFDRHGTNPLEELAIYNAYKKLLKTEKPDIVFTYTIKPNVYGGMACASFGIPYVATITGLGIAMENGGILQKVAKFLYIYGLRKAQKVFFQNASNKALFEEWDIVHENAQLIPGSGVNLSYHTPYEYPVDSDEIRFLFIGRIMKDKGINELLAAMEQVHAKYPNASLDIVGGLDGDYQKVIDSANQLSFVTYHGRQADVRPYIRNAHCTVLPSYHEGTANVLLESASAARPVIATKVPGCQETFIEGISGSGCNPKDKDSLAEAMIRFIELPYEKKVEMGIAGRKKMESEYDRNIVVNAYINEVQKIRK